MRVERAITGGTQVLEISGPAVLAASTDAAVPRLPGMKDILAATKKPVQSLTLAELGGAGIGSHGHRERARRVPI